MRSRPACLRDAERYKLVIKIISGYSHAAGSTLALVNLCNQFNSRGHACTFYGPDHWHLDKCRSGKLAEFMPEAGDLIIANDIPLLSIDELSNIDALVEESGRGRLLKALREIALKILPANKPRDYQLFLSCLRDDGLPQSALRFSFFQKVHFASRALKSYTPTAYPKFIAPSFCNGLNKTEQKPERIAGIIGSIKRQNNIVEAIEKALLDGMETMILFGYMKDPAYYYDKIVPLTIQHPGKIKYAGFMDDRQQMYDAVSDVYSSANKPWSVVSHECAMTNTRFHVSEPMSADDRMTDEQIFEIWKKELALSSGVA